MRRWAAVVGTAALAVALLVRPGPAPAQQALRIGYPVWVGYGPLFLADRKGMLADLGVNVDFVLMEDTKTRYVALAAGK
ncbi:MAG: taurine ABC transporter substrate-binding protein, partial [Armatimonadota bacterium]|nr:taurine ABC transporter substrate-binding protein [Armatimonadota bacterium]